MQLLKLEAYGFKSFADKLEIEFNKGITAIVGPNGSGKSNITDAIKWVLGEQNVRNLRGAKTEDIIFSGGSKRRALGVAEVSLTFDNSDGELSLDFKEIVVTRRIFRSGESEYYINKAQCRLKDIHELFADTGLGKDALSVISQNKIDQVLNSKPEERRFLFEEAAGITKYRNRKRESLRKLEDTEQNILRVSDIVSEVENQLGPLAESAKKTEKFNELNDKFRISKITVLMNNFDKYKKFFHDSEKQKNIVIQDEQMINTELNLQEVAREQLNNELIEVEKSLNLLIEKNNELVGKIEKNQSNITIYQERIKQSEESSLRVKNEMNTVDQKHIDAQLKFKKTQASLVCLQEQEIKLEAFSEEQRKIEQILGVKIKNTEEQITKIKEESLEQVKNLVSEKNKCIVLQRDIDKLKNMISSLESEKVSCDLQIERNVFGFNELKCKLDTISSEIQKSDTTRTELTLKAQEYTKQLDLLNAEMNRCIQALNESKTRVQFLTGMQKEYEGFGRATKAILKGKNPWNVGICGAVAEVISVPENYVIAIEIALGGNLQNIIAENDAIAKEAIAYLKKEKLGRVTFFPLNTIANGAKIQRDNSFENMDGFIDYADRLVDCDIKYRKIIESLLARTIVVTNIDVALKLARRQNFKVRIVTLEGELVNPGGSMTGGSIQRREASFLNRSSEIENVQRTITSLEQKMKDYQPQQKNIEERLQLYKKRILEIDNTKQQYKVEQAELRVHVENYQLESDRNKNLLCRLCEQLNTYKIELDKIEADKLHTKESITKLEMLDFTQKTDDENATMILKKLKEEKNKIMESLVDTKIKSKMLQQEIIQNQEMSKMLDLELEQYQQNSINLQNELDRLENTLCTIKKELVELNTCNFRLKELKAIAEKDYNNFHSIKLDKLAKIQENDKQIKEIRKRYNEIQNRMHQIDILYTKYQFEMNHCVEQLEKNYEVSIEEATELKTDEKNDILGKQIKDLEIQISALGSVNPNAIQEYEILNERYHFMKKQIDDLIIAKDYLDGIIKEIDTTMSKQFLNAFEKINTFFGHIFSNLFGGGQARLELANTDKSILEAGIEIIVQPPEKKSQSLSVLSGGERALTVIALLFSFLSFKPAPFTVVDEIDAPLDEANVDRFGSFLKDFSKQTQFIVVTHRKGTMQVADVMHGVTVEDSGVSKVISVKLEDEII